MVTPGQWQLVDYAVDGDHEVRLLCAEPRVLADDVTWHTGDFTLFAEVFVSLQGITS